MTVHIKRIRKYWLTTTRKKLINFAKVKLKTAYGD